MDSRHFAKNKTERKNHIDSEYILKDNVEILNTSQKSEAKPFLKWAGGKRSLIGQITPHLPKDFACYYEPFLGGGAVFFSLITHQYTSYLSDKNEQLMLTYKVIQDNPEKLIQVLEKHHLAHNANYYKSMRNASGCEDPIEIAGRFIYLNRTCFNGLYRVNRSGIFNVPMGKYTNPQICDSKNILAVSQSLKHASVFLSDFKNIDPQENDFVYCDPPYHDAFVDYTAGGFTENDQGTLKTCVDNWVKKGVQVMISQSDTPFIRNLYKEYTILEVTSFRLINCQPEGRGPSSDLLILTYNT